ncbi:MAG: hypothetical protein GQ531_09845 [Sulfurovum sp.]|nr:hypothetical protein [Sulfurovum sp.]
MKIEQMIAPRNKNIIMMGAKIDKLIENLNGDEDIIYMKKNLLEEINGISRVPIPRPDEQIRDATKILYREEREKLLATCRT